MMGNRMILWKKGQNIGSVGELNNQKPANRQNNKERLLCWYYYSCYESPIAVHTDDSLLLVIYDSQLSIAEGFITYWENT